MGEIGSAAEAAAHAGIDAANLQIGDPLQLHSLPDDERYYVRLVGMMPGRSVLVTAPMRSDRVLLLRHGHPFIVRAFSGKDAFAFNASIARVCNAPFPYLHLTYPKEVRGVAVRREERIRAHLIASVLAPGAGQPVAAVMSDLSAGGARLDAPRALGAPGETVRVSFRIKVEADDAMFSSEAIVRSAQPQDDAAREPVVRHGLEFSGMPANERLLLKALIYQHLTEGRVLGGTQE